MQDCTAQHPGFLQIYSKAGMQCLEQGAERRVPGIARDSRHAPKLCKISEIGEVMGKNVSCKHGPAQADVISDLMPFMSPRPNQTLYICWLSDKKINIYKKKTTQDVQFHLTVQKEASNGEQPWVCSPTK